MEVTEKWLGEIGGWAAMKAARGLAEAGLAAIQSVEPELFRGTAGGGKMKFSCGLKIRSRSDVENLCTCPAARRGLICEHSLAVGVVIARGGRVGGLKTRSPEDVPAVRAPASLPPLKPQRARGQYEVFLPETILQGRGREPLGVFVRFVAGQAGEESRLAGWLADQGMAERSGPLSLGGDELARFLEALRGHPRVVAGRPSGGGQNVTVSETDIPLQLKVEAEPDDATVRLQLSAGSPQPVGGGELQNWLIDNETVTMFALPEMGAEVRALFLELTQTAAVRRPLRWYVAHSLALAGGFLQTLQGTFLSRFHVTHVPFQITLSVDGSLQALEVRVAAEFQGQHWQLGPSTASTELLFPIQDASIKSTFYLRDIDGENRFLDRLRAVGFVSQDEVAWRLTGADAVARFIASELPRIQAAVKIEASDRFRSVTENLTRIAPVVKPLTRVDNASPVTDSGWLSMDFSYQAPDGFRLPRSEVLRLVRSGQRMVQGKNGKRYLLDVQGAEEFEETLRDVPVELTPEGARMNPLHASYFLPESGSLALALRSDGEIAPLLGDLGAALRAYQLTGVRWIDALIRSGRGGVLGDEMGLGKTVQSIAAVQLLAAQGLGSLAASQGGALDSAGMPVAGSLSQVLVICPKSLVGNWQAEFARFAPGSKVVAVQGAGRGKALANLSESDVIITTYQLIVRDIEHYRKIHFALAVLDEASYIRNPDTDAAKVVRQLRAKARLALTGTPVENSTRDLWSIYQFALPGYLGSRENFRERFEIPIQNNLDTPAGQAASARLKKLIRPYFLRRTKKEVVRELPEKIEQVLWCDPSPAQAETYRRLLEEGREEIKAARRRSGQGGAKMTMFTVLLRLRQACCDLRLTGMSGEALAGLERDDLSGKWGMWEERLTEILEGGGKVLIFSQFVKYLHLLRDNLEALKVKFSYLDGSTQDRDAQVKTFQSNPEHRVFLISLKAGGYGLNLTAADHVMLMDPWWNPAVEAQAIDRAHRIGQQRVVTAYRLAVRGTVEERILALQARKRGLIEAKTCSPEHVK